MNLIANNNKQQLLEHSQRVAEAGEQSVAQLLPDFDAIELRLLQLAVMLSGLHHDLGKLTDDFQAYIKGEKDYRAEIGEGKLYSADNPLHHEISLVLFDALWQQTESHLLPGEFKKQSMAKRELKARIRFGIYWHHAEPYREKSFERVLSNYLEDEECLKDLVKVVNQFSSELLSTEIRLTNDDLLNSLERLKAPPFFDVSSTAPVDYSKWLVSFQKDLDKNLFRQLTRFFTIRADRYVSSLSIEKMGQPLVHDSFDDAALLQEINNYIDLPLLAGRRTEQQKQAADMLVHNDSNTLMGPAGSGKTRLAFIAYFKARMETDSCHSGMLWTCPRIAVAHSVLEEITASLPKTKVAILTGETQQVWYQNERIELDIFEADIVITTVDQVVKWFTSNGSSTYFSEFIQRYVVFDEYHELFAIQSLYYMSALLMRLKEHQKQGHLFISATPEPMHLRLICKKDASWQYPVILESFNDQPVKLSFATDARMNEEGTAYIFNTASLAQKHAMDSWLTGREDVMCYHSKFTPSDKATLTHDVLNMFGQNTVDDKATLFSGPIGQSSLNISRMNLVTEATHPANQLQRIGRSNRFAEYGNAAVTVLVSKNQISEKQGKYGTSGHVKNTGARKINIKGGRVVSSKEQYYSNFSYSFYAELIKEFGAGQKRPDQLVGHSFTVTLNQLNTFYLNFYINQVEKAGKLVDETKEFVTDAIRYLDAVGLYKPIKMTVETSQGREVRVSYRGGSQWATMSQITASTEMSYAGELIGLPNQQEQLVSVTYTESYDLNLVGNLMATTEPEFNPLKSSLKYRAQNSGRSKGAHLTYLAKNIAYPLVCSTNSDANQLGLYYLSVKNDRGNILNVGYKRLKNGVESLQNTLKGNDEK